MCPWSLLAQFMKLVLTVTGKDLSHFMEQWVLRSGIACFHSSYTYTLKKNQVERRLVQDPPRAYSKFMVSDSQSSRPIKEFYIIKLIPMNSFSFQGGTLQMSLFEVLLPVGDIR